MTASADTAASEPVAEFEAICDLIPEDAYWGMPLTPDLVRYIRDCSTAPTTGSAPGMTWTDGEPPKPWRTEWFIAETIYGDRVVLCALPDEFSYDYKTADDTYMLAKNIKRWMQFPDSLYIAPPANAPVASVLSDAQKVAMHNVVVKAGGYSNGLLDAMYKALLAASMGGDRT